MNTARRTMIRMKRPTVAALALEPSRLSELLRYFGQGRITREAFWARMNEYELTDRDIDAYSATEARSTYPYHPPRPSTPEQLAAFDRMMALQRSAA